MMSHETGYIFEPQLIKSPSNNFQEYFEQFGGLRLSCRSFSVYPPATITQQPLCQDSSVLVFGKGH